MEKCLMLLHIYLFGLIAIASLGGKKYTLVIVDDYSKFTWVYFLRTKNEASENLIKPINLVENQKAETVKP